jgi:hypothetical protein
MEVDMMKREDARKAHAEANAAIREAFKGINLTLKEGSSLSYDPRTGECTLRIKFVAGGAEEAEGAASAKWERDRHYVGLGTVPYRFTFDGYGEAFECIEVRPRSRKYPVIARSLATGRLMKWSAITVRNAFDSRRPTA